MSELVHIRRRRDGELLGLARKRTWAPRDMRRDLRRGTPEPACAGMPSRPTRRADCIDGPRPCPWLSCRHHLALDVSSTGSLTTHAPLEQDDGLALEAMLETCSLDVADRGEHTLEEVGEILGVVRERARQIIEVAFVRVRRQRRPELLELAGHVSEVA